MGKTAVLKSLLPLLDQSGESPCVCKIDCLQSKDAVTFQKMKYPCVTGLSGDICPDHFLVSNLPELWQWTDAMQRNLLVIETAGLCHRCSPATKHMLAGCVVDCTVSCKAPGQLGPMLTQADFVVLTKVDMISQAESFAGKLGKSIPKRKFSLLMLLPVMVLTYWHNGYLPNPAIWTLLRIHCGTQCPVVCAPTA